MRQSTAQSRHQLLPACGACKWCVSAGRRCSGCGLSSSAYGPRPSTQTRPFSSVSALVAAAFDPAVGSAAFGVHPGDSRAAGINTRAASLHLAAPFTPEPQPQHRMASTAGLGCHCRLACAKAMSAAISSPFTSLASHCIWCTRRTRLVPRIRSLALRTSANRPRIRTEATDADATIFVAIGAYSGGSRACGWFSRSLSPPW